MFDGKIMKKILMGAGFLLLITGQITLINGKNLFLSISLMLLCVVFFAIALTEKYNLIFDFFIKLKLYFSLKKLKKQSEISINDEKNLFDKKKYFSQPNKKYLLTGILENNKGFSFNLFIPKWILFLTVLVLFIITQLFFFKQELNIAFLLLALDIAVLVITFFVKKGFNLELGLENGIKIILFVLGTLFVVVGWMLLINYAVNIQEIGVAFTIPGTIMLFLSLPKTDTKQLPDTLTNDIVFLKPEFLNSYVAKGLMLIVAFVFLKIGTIIMHHADLNMFSMIFYAISGMLIFLSLPLFNFPDKRFDNKIFDFIKLGIIIVAFAVAYKGQILFVKNDVNNAILYYFIAAILFIFAFPVYKLNEDVEKHDFPINLEVIILLVIVVVGIYLRVHEINVRPFGIENDEAGGAISRFDIHGNPVMDYSVGNFGIPMHIVQFFIFIFGELNRLSLKMLGVSVGILSLPLFYFLIRSALGPRAAIFTAVIYTFLRWNVYYGRYGCTYIYSNAMEISMLYFTIKAFKTRNKFIWFMLGLCVGLAWHGVMTAFLLIFPILIYYTIKAFSEKGYLKHNIVPLLAFFLGFWIFGSMIVHNYFISKSIYFSRVSDVSVFSKDPNAPRKNVAEGIVQNAKDVMLMFNHRGDSRQRNSGGMPYEPTIDFLTSIFFAIGLLYSLYYSKYYLFFIMLIVFFSQAAGSIFSIEAPSAMRAIGTMFPMLFFIAITFDRIWLSVRRAFGKKLEIIYLPLLMLVFLVPIAKENYDQYFNRWVGGLDELATAGGMYAKELGKKTWILLYTNLYYPGHPPFKIYRWDYHAHSGPSLTTGLMWLKDVKDDESFAIFSHYDTWENIYSIRDTLFPDSAITVVDHHYFNHKIKEGGGFGDFFKVIDITSAQIQKMRGLTAKYSFGGNVGNNENIMFNEIDKDKVPYNVTWSGLLLIPYYGRYSFFNNEKCRYLLSVDGHPLEPHVDYTLAEGFHKIRLTAFRNNNIDGIQMEMVCKKLVDGDNVANIENILITKNYLYNFKSVGLHGYYYKGNDWNNSPIDHESINLNMRLNSGSFANVSEIWKGSIIAPVDDVYNFSTNCNGYLRVVIDGKYYWENSNAGVELPDNVKNYFKNWKRIKVKSFKLSAGKHKIVIYCSKASVLELQWSREGAKNVIPVPMNAFEPD